MPCARKAPVNDAVLQQLVGLSWVCRVLAALLARQLFGGSLGGVRFLRGSRLRDPAAVDESSETQTFSAEVRGMRTTDILWM